MKILEIVALLMLLIALGLGGYLFLLSYPGESVSYEPFSTNFSGITGEQAEGISASSSIVQFYPNMRFRDKNISYELESACNEKKVTDVEKAFSILSEKTILRFYNSKENPGIVIMCSEIAPKAEEKGHFIAGEGGPSEIVNTSNYAVILNGRISLFRKETCDEPKIAIHEILHVLGFDHYDNPDSIMYPVVSCEEKIDQEIIDDINILYSTKSLPDLMIESIAANRTGKYLNFDINISNAGLADSKGANLEVYAGDDRIGDFAVGKLEIGMMRLMFVQNLKLSGNYDKIAFVIAAEDEEELTLKNNRAELSVA